jgi:hypothetical protein
MGWLRTQHAWWGAHAVPGSDLVVDVPKTTHEGLRGRTLFEVAVCWAGSGPGKGPVLWSGTYWVRNTPEGPILEKAE